MAAAIDPKCTYAVVTVGSDTVRVFPWRIDPHHTNQALPLTCGHRHTTGDVVWCSVGDKVVLCSRCREDKEAAR